MKFQVYPDAKTQWRWRLVSTNGRIVADSAEAYSSKGNVERAIATVIEGVATLRHLKGEDPKGIEELDGEPHP